MIATGVRPRVPVGERISLAGKEFQRAVGCVLADGIGLAISIGTMAHGRNNTSDWILLLSVAVIAGVGFLTVAAWSKTPTSRADQWRRTSAGWERATEWPVFREIRTVSRPLPASAISKANDSRYDTHPAVLAFLQIIGVLAALSVFTVPAPQTFRGWRALLKQSFRASAFGS